MKDKIKCVYKLKCKDTNITEFYIGSSIDFDGRIKTHYYDCCNKSSSHYDINVYKFIRDNGGYDNWEFEVIKEYKFITKKELTINEQYYLDNLKPQLNGRNAFGHDLLANKKKYYKNNKVKINKKQTEKIKCDLCDKLISRSNIARHKKDSCKEVKPQPNKCGYEYPGWEWDEGLP